MGERAGQGQRFNAGLGNLQEQLDNIGGALQNIAKNNHINIDVESKGVKETQKNLENYSKSVEKAVDTSQKLREMSISDKDIINTDKVQERIKVLKQQMQEVYDKVYDANGKRVSSDNLPVQEAHKYIQAFMELQQYAQKSGEEIEATYQRVFDNISNLISKRAADGLANRMPMLYAQAQKMYEKTFGSGAEQALKSGVKQQTNTQTSNVGEKTAQDQKKAQDAIFNTTQMVKDLMELFKNLSANNIKLFDESHGGILGVSEDGIAKVHKRLIDIKQVFTQLTRQDPSQGDGFLKAWNNDSGIASIERKAELLKKLGYTIGELKTSEGGDIVSAQIMPIPDKAITNAEEMLRILLNINQQRQENPGTERQVTDIEKLKKAIEDYERAVTRARNLSVDSIIGGNSRSGNALPGAIQDMEAMRTEIDHLIQSIQSAAGQGVRIDTSALDQLKQKFETINQVRNAVVNKSDTLGFEDVNKAYQTLIQYADKYVQITQKQFSGQVLSYNEMDWLQKYGQYYEDAANKAGIFEAKQKEVKDLLDQKFATQMTDSFQKYVTGMYDHLGLQLNALGDKSLNAQGVEKLNQMKATYEDIGRQISNINNLTGEQRQKLVQNVRETEKMASAMNKNVKAYQDADPAKVTSLANRITQFMNVNTKAADYFPQLSALRSELDKGVSTERLREITAEFNKISDAAGRAGKMGKSFTDNLSRGFSSLTRYLGTYVSFYRLIAAIKSGINTVKEFDTALMEVRKVSTETQESLEAWQKTTFDMANGVGGSALQLQKSTASWLRLGKDFQEAQEAAQASIKLLNVSEFTNIDDATKSLISISQAYKDLTYDDVIDKLNNVGDHFSSSTDQLARGLQNAAAVLKTQGNNIDQALALLTAGKLLPERFRNEFYRTYLIALIA